MNVAYLDYAMLCNHQIQYNLKVKTVHKFFDINLLNQLHIICVCAKLNSYILLLQIMLPIQKNELLY